MSQKPTIDNLISWVKAVDNRGATVGLVVTDANLLVAEIERLRIELEVEKGAVMFWKQTCNDFAKDALKAREALREIVNLKPEYGSDTLQAIRHIGKLIAIARAALPEFLKEDA